MAEDIYKFPSLEASRILMESGLWLDAGIFPTSGVEKSRVSCLDIPAVVGYEEAGIMRDSPIFTEKLRIYSIYKKIINFAKKHKKST